MDMTLRTLSPVHIGSGNNIEPFDYVTRFRDGKGTFARINLDAFAERVLDIKPEAIGDFTEWISQTAERLDRTQNQDKFRVRREFKLDRFARERLKASDLADALIDDETLYYYQQPINTDRDYEVKEQIKTADNGLYIPGSSLKGALRTALAFQVLSEADEAFKRELVDGVHGTDRMGLRYNVEKRNQQRLGEEIDKAIFRCGRRSQQRTQYSEVHFDLLRALYVSDTFNPDAQIGILETSTFVREKPHEGNQGSRLKPQLPILLESVLPGSVFTIRLGTDLGFLRLARENKDGNWVGLNERFTRLFGFTIDDLHQMDQETASAHILDRVRLACRNFSKAIVSEEVKWAEQFDQSTTAHIIDFYQKMEKISKATPVVRLGWGSHFMSTTLFLAFRKDPILKRMLGDIARSFPLVRAPRGRSSKRPNFNPDRFPQSRRLVCKGQLPFAPFGWVAFSDPTVELGDPLVDVDELTRLHRSQQPARGGRSQLHPPHTGGQRESPRETERSQKDMQEALRGWRPVQQPQESQVKVREGQRVNAEVISNDGRTVVVRLVDNQKEEVRFQQLAYPKKPGDRVKVRVQRVDNNTGKVTRVVP